MKNKAPNREPDFTYVCGKCRGAGERLRYVSASGQCSRCGTVTNGVLQ